jgi:CHASE3 domain sensor protein
MSTSLHKRLTIALFLTAIILLLISGISAYHKFNYVMRVDNDISQSYQTLRAANQSLLSIDEAALEVSTFLLTNNLDAIKNLPEIIVSAQVNYLTLMKLTQDNVNQAQIAKVLKPIFDEKIESLKNIISAYNADNKEAAVKISGDTNRLTKTSQIIQSIIDIKKIEIGQLERSLRQVNLDKEAANSFYIVVGSCNVSLFLFIFVCVRRYLN